MKLKLDWFHGLKEEEKRERKELVLSARPTLDVLRGILVKRLKELDVLETSKESYDSPSWALQQADLIGSKRELKRMIDLLTIEERE